MLTAAEREFVAGFFTKGRRVLDFTTPAFHRFVENVLWHRLPRGHDAMAATCVDAFREFVTSESAPYLEVILLVKALLHYYEAAVATPGYSARRMRNDTAYRVCRLIIMREAVAHLKTKPPVEDVLPYLQPPPAHDVRPRSQYYFALWRRALELYPVWNDIDINSLARDDILYRGFDAELLVVAQGFRAVETLERTLAAKAAEGNALRVAHLFMRSSAMRRAIDAMTCFEVRLHCTFMPDWLQNAIQEYNSALRGVFTAFMPQMKVASFMAWANAAEVCMDRWEDWTALGLGDAERIFLRVLDFRTAAARAMRLADVFAFDLNVRECNGRKVFFEPEPGSAAEWEALREQPAMALHEGRYTIMAFCRQVARRVKNEIPAVRNLSQAVAYILFAQSGERLHALCRKVREYKNEYGWSDALFLKIIRSPKRRIRLKD